jgi:ABC-type multidrug transport system ATPase subunit
MLRINRASCAVGKRVIFEAFSLEVQPGERVHLAGPNGVGKTSVLRCVGGTMALTVGSAEIGGYPAGSDNARALTGSCVEPEKGLYSALSGRQNLLFAARLRFSRREARALVDCVEGELGITDFAQEKVLHYSAGMRARVVIARALLGNPALLLLDEPTRSLDDAGRELLWAALARRNAVACVLASHLPLDRDRCDRTVTLAGRS